MRISGSARKQWIPSDEEVRHVMEIWGEMYYGGTGRLAMKLGTSEWKARKLIELGLKRQQHDNKTNSSAAQRA